RLGTPQQHRPVGEPHEAGRGVGDGVDGDGGDAHLPTGPDDPFGDLAPIGDEESAYHRHHILNAPQALVPFTGPECTAESTMPSAARVSRGSMMPSSRTRPVLNQDCSSWVIWASIRA